MLGIYIARGPKIACSNKYRMCNSKKIVVGLVGYTYNILKWLNYNNNHVSFLKKKTVFFYI